MIKNYITTLLEEKNIDLQETFVVDVRSDYSHIYSYEQFVEDLAEFLKDNAVMQNKIRNTFVKIDFVNGNVKDYIDFLAAGMIMSVESQA